jgi:hypothetical protein
MASSEGRSWGHWDLYPEALKRGGVPDVVAPLYSRGTAVHTSWPGLSGPPDTARCWFEWPGDPPNKSGEGHDGKGGFTPFNMLYLAHTAPAP